MSRWRYIKFGLVGASGTVVNLLVLYLAQEFLLAFIEPATQRLYASLACAIGLATVNNFYWNRRWTWQDRQSQWRGSTGGQFVRYALASWLGTSVQYILTLWMAQHMHYLLGNVLAIVVASVVNYAANDWWTFRGNPRDVSEDETRLRYRHISFALLLLTFGVYLFDLGGENIPRNGDELVYAHIALQTWLKTSVTGHWLPLVSAIQDMRNTKPPLLIWQAMVPLWLGLDWSLWWIRLPSLLYTLATTVLVVWATRRLARWPSMQATVERAPLDAVTLSYIAGLIYLGCFSTYRYGRPYLTSAIETFWMGLPFWALLAVQWRAQQRARLSGTSPVATASHASTIGRSAASVLPGAGFFALTGLSWGMVALHKSFVLLAPLGATLWLALCWQHPRQWWGAMWRTALAVALGTGLFALWFLVDPDPMSVWREFVVGENWGKVGGAQESVYWRTALMGGSSIWVQSLALVQNGLVLGPLIAAVMVMGLKAWPATWRARQQGEVRPTALLWIYIAVMSLFFMVPSQRSARYLIPLMPMVAVLCALQLWQLPRWAQRVSLVLGCLMGLGGLAFLGLFLWGGWRLDLYPLWGRLGLLLILVLQVLALLRLLWPSATDTTLRASWLWLLGLCVSLFAWFGLLNAPLHSPGNQYDARAQARVKGAHLLTPSNFNGDFERWRFVLPGVRDITPYREETPTDAAQLRDWFKDHEAVIVRRVWNEAEPDCEAAGCEVIGQRLAIRGRHRSGEINWQSVQTPEVLLFWREYLLVKR